MSDFIKCKSEDLKEEFEESDLKHKKTQRFTEDSDGEDEEEDAEHSERGAGNDYDTNHSDRGATPNFTRKQLRLIIVEQFQKNVPQRKIAKTLKIPPSTVHNVIKRFREKGEISLQETQGRKSLLNAGDVQILKEHCIKNRHNSLLEITAWAQEHFQKFVSVNAIRRAIQREKIKLLHGQKKSSLDQCLFNETKNMPAFGESEAKLSVAEFKEKYLEPKKEFIDSTEKKEDENTSDQDRPVILQQGLTDAEEQEKDAVRSGSNDTYQEMFTWRALQEARKHSSGDFRRKSIFELDESSELQSNHMTDPDNEDDHLDRGPSTNFTRKQLRLIIVEQFLRNVSQRKIAKTLNIPPSTVHNIIKRFREKGEISVQETQGRKPLLNACDVQILKEHCIKNRHNSLLELTAWAQQHFQKFVSVNAIRRAMQKEKIKLRHGQKKSSLDQYLFNETRSMSNFADSEAKLSVEELKEDYLEPKKEFIDSVEKKEDENTADQDRPVTPQQRLTDTEEQEKDAERSGSSDTDQEMFTWRALQEAKEHSGGDFGRKSIFELDESSELQNNHMTDQDNEDDHLDSGLSTNFTRKQLRLIIVEQFQKNISQRKIAKTLNIPSSTVHNIIKRFRETGEISEQETQGRKPLLNAGDLEILKEHCIKNRHNSLLELTAWAQKHFQKFVSVNAIRRAMQKKKIKLLHGQKKSSLDQRLFNETTSMSDFGESEAKLSVEELEEYLEPKKEFIDSDGEKEDENTADQDRPATPQQGLTDTEEQEKDAERSGSNDTDQEMFTWRALQEAREHSGGDFRRKSIFELDESSELQSNHMKDQDNKIDQLYRGATTNFTRKQLRLMIVEQYQRNVSQRKIAKTLNIPSSTVHNIIKKFRETGEISVQETQGRKSLLNAGELQILKQHCIKNRHSSLLELTAWAQEHFQKSVSVKTVQRAMQKCKIKLFHANKSGFGGL